MIRLENVSIVFQGKPLFADVNLQITETSRIGLIGVNGSGKSTLLKILAGIQEIDAGNIERAKNFTVGYLPQELHGSSERTVFEEALSGCGTARNLQLRMEEVTTAMHQVDASSEEYTELVMEFGRLQHLYEESDGFSLESKTSRVLQGLAIPSEWWQRPMKQLSGGWQMRVHLARLILSAPSLLLLDEPTNHLDVEAILWLSEFLRTYEGGLILISHDRYFLDENIRQAIEIWNNKLHFYAGNYSYYVAEKQKRLELLYSAYESQKEEIERTQKFIDRFRYKATKAKQVQSRLKMLEKIDRIELPQDTSQIRLRIPAAPRSGRQVLEGSQLGHSYGEKEVFHGLEFSIERGDKVALVGVNGAGKTTLLKILAGEMPPSEGSFKLGHNVIPAYYAQLVTDKLDLTNTILQEISNTATDQNDTQLRSLLGSFLFTGEDVYKKISVLSGGEKSRVALAKILLEPSNLLLLDEPTNHLDLNSKELLLQALLEYEGTILFISHDRYFMDQLSQKVLELRDGALRVYLGNYSEYLRKAEQDQTPVREAAAPASTSAPAPASHKSKDQKRAEAEKRREQSKWKKEILEPLAEAERRIAACESRIKELEKLLADEQVYAQKDRFHEYIEYISEYQKQKDTLEEQYKNWERLEKRKNELVGTDE